VWRATDAHANPASKQWHSSRQPVEGWRRTPQTDATALLGLIAFSRSSVFLAPIVLALEFFDATSGVYELLLARVERMRSGTDIDHHQRKRLAVDFASTLGLDRRASDKLNTRGSVLEHDLVVFGMNAVFHDPLPGRKRVLERGSELDFCGNPKILWPFNPRSTLWGTQNFKPFRTRLQATSNLSFLFTITAVTSNGVLTHTEISREHR
jgi:hypothetical protein